MASVERGGMAKGLFIGFLAGSIVGAIAALLTAPKSGKELRSDIKRKAEGLAEDASDYMKNARERTVEMINQGKERSDALISDAKEQAEHLLGDAEKVLTGIRERAGGESGKVKAAFRAGVDAYKNEKNRDNV
jgi:gas vesicle protein